MKKTIICSLPFKPNVDKVIYESTDMSMKVANREVRFPVNALLEGIITDEDELKVLLLVKQDKNNFYEKNKEFFLEELYQVTDKLHVKVGVEYIYTEFSQTREVHESLLDELIDNIEDDSHILADITYGPKDEPIIIFAALKFAEKHLNCDIEGIIYGLAQFDDNHHVVEGKLCDMSSLFYLSSVADSFECTTSEKARRMMKALISV